MRKLITLFAGLAAAPIVALAAPQASALADTPGVSPTCFPQSMNPHPTDPAGTTTNTLFCATPTPSVSGGSGSTSGGIDGSHQQNTGGSGRTGGGSTTSLAGYIDPGSTGSAPDESGVDLGSDSTGTASDRGASFAAGDTGLFGGLVAVFRTAGGLAFLFGTLLLLLVIAAAVAAIVWLRRGHAQNWPSRLSRLTFRA